MNRLRHAFTLVEVALATLVLVSSCLVVLMLIPNAIAVQQESRDKMLVALHAQTVLTNFYYHEYDLYGSNTWLNLLDWEVRDLYSFSLGSHWSEQTLAPGAGVQNQRWLQAVGEFDLERIAVTRMGGNYPVPLAIARRLNSPNDEIKHILDNGGYIYYSDTIGGDRMKARFANEMITDERNELQQVVWGIVGSPQQNILVVNPFQTTQSEMYPHPPLARGRPIDRVFDGRLNFSREFSHSQFYAAGAQIDDNSVAGPAGATINFYNLSYKGSELKALYAGANGGGPWGYDDWKNWNEAYEAHTMNGQDGDSELSTDIAEHSMYEGNTWQWYAFKYRDVVTSDPEEKWFGKPRDHDTWVDYQGYGGRMTTLRAGDEYHRRSRFGEVNVFNGTTYETPLNRPYYDAGESYYTTLDAFNDLVNRNWLRIVHQVDEINMVANVPGGGGSSSTRVAQTRYRDVAYTVPCPGCDLCTGPYATMVPGHVQFDDWGRPVMLTRSEPYTVWLNILNGNQDHDGGGVGGGSVIGGFFNTDSAGKLDQKSVKLGNPIGYPQPAQGLGFSRLRGTDILEEDAVVVGKLDQYEQIRIGLPSLERRVKYRTAALILWAKVAYGKDIRHVEDPTLAYVAPPSGSGLPAPTAAAGRQVLAANENPLYSWQNLSGFTDGNGDIIKTDLHPTEVEALNHLAHAAMMVTGYKKPFYLDRNTREAGDDQLLVDDKVHPRYGAYNDELPFKAVSATPMEAGTYNDTGSAATSFWTLSQALNGGNQVEVCTSVDPVADTATFTTITLDGSGTCAATDLAGMFFADNNGDGVADHALVDRDGVASATRVQVLDPGQWIYLRNPYSFDCLHHPHQNLDHFRSPRPLVTARPQELMTYAKPCRDPEVGGNGRLVWDRPIMYRPMEGTVINPCPPPYADRGAFDAGGTRQFAFTWQFVIDFEDNGTPTDVADDKPAYRLLRKIKRNAYNASLENLDTKWARNAHEACLRAVMSFCANNPYDQRVARPANRQTFMDRGIWTKDIFDASGNALRPQDIRAAQGPEALLNEFYGLTCPIDPTVRADLIGNNMAYAHPLFVDTLLEYGEPAMRFQQFNNAVHNGNGQRRKGSLCVRRMHRNHAVRLGEAFRLGEVQTNRVGLVDPEWGWHVKTQKTENFWRNPQIYQRIANQLLGKTVASDSVAHPQDGETPLRTGRCTAPRAFSPQERARQLVYWKANWMQYVDFESAPSAPVDWSQLPSYFSGTWWEHSEMKMYSGSDGSGPHVKNIAKDGQWEIRINTPDNAWKVGDVFRICRTKADGGVAPITEVRCTQVVDTGWDSNIWITPTDATLDFRDSTFWPGCRIHWYEKTQPNCTYDTWAADQGKPAWNQEPDDADVNSWWYDHPWRHVNQDPPATNNHADYPTVFQPLVYDINSTSRSEGVGKFIVYYKRTWKAMYNHPESYDMEYGQSVQWNTDQKIYAVFDVTRPQQAPNESRFLSGHPEKSFTFSSPGRNRTLTAIADPSSLIYVHYSHGAFDPLNTNEEDPNQLIGTTADEDGTASVWRFAGPYPAMRIEFTDENYQPFLNIGCFGADRNHDGKFSRGTVETSVRMQAREICRINFYDPIGWISVGR